MGRTLLGLVVASCGFRHGRVPTDTGAPVDDGQPIGGDADPMPLGPWSAPTPFPELTAPGTALDDPTLTADMLEIYFNSNRSGNDDIWMSTRSTTSSVWNDPTLVAELNTISRESDPEVSYDGLVI